MSKEVIKFSVFKEQLAEELKKPKTAIILLLSDEVESQQQIIEQFMQFGGKVLKIYINKKKTQILLSGPSINKEARYLVGTPIQKLLVDQILPIIEEIRPCSMLALMHDISDAKILRKEFNKYGYKIRVYRVKYRLKKVTVTVNIIYYDRRNFDLSWGNSLDELRTYFNTCLELLRGEKRSFEEILSMRHNGPILFTKVILDHLIKITEKNRAECNYIIFSESLPKANILRTSIRNLILNVYSVTGCLELKKLLEDIHLASRNLIINILIIPHQILEDEDFKILIGILREFNASVIFMLSGGSMFLQRKNPQRYYKYLKDKLKMCFNGLEVEFNELRQHIVVSREYHLCHTPVMEYTKRHLWIFRPVLKIRVLNMTFLAWVWAIEVAIINLDEKLWEKVLEITVSNAYLQSNDEYNLGRRPMTPVTYGKLGFLLRNREANNVILIVGFGPSFDDISLYIDHVECSRCSSPVIVQNQDFELVNYLISIFFKEIFRVFRG